MTTNNLRVAPAQQIGPLQVWPLLWESLTSHQYKVSSPLDLLEFEEFEEEDGPVVDWIQVHNPTENPILIPSGWVISKDLLQERTLISAEYVEPHSTSAINVSCVEKGRWEETDTVRRSVRAPISVMAAGFDFDSNKGMWILDPKTRQERVWSQIERQENRSGKRVTNALTQIMDEDSRMFELQKSVVKDLRATLNVYPKQNGVLIALDGQPLLSEFFSNPEGIHRTVRKTLLAASFDATSIEQKGINKEQVLRFLDEVRATKIHAIQEESWGSHFSGGTESLDTHLTKSSDERVMRVSTINRTHKALVGI
jgi:hypothetical protein